MDIRVLNYSSSLYSSLLAMSLTLTPGMTKTYASRSARPFVCIHWRFVMDIYLVFYWTTACCDPVHFTIERTQVLILGGGMAGVAAANTLLAAGIRDFVLLEATGRIGGRVHETNLYGMHSVELCCIHSIFTEFCNMIKNLYFLSCYKTLVFIIFRTNVLTKLSLGTPYMSKLSLCLQTSLYFLEITSCLKLRWNYFK